MEKVKTLAATLSSGAATSSSRFFHEGTVNLDAVTASMVGNYTVQRSVDDSSWVSIETFTADAVKAIKHGGGYLRATSSISSGSVAVTLSQEDKPSR